MFAGRRWRTACGCWFFSSLVTPPLWHVSVPGLIPFGSPGVRRLALQPVLVLTNLPRSKSMRSGCGGRICYRGRRKTVGLAGKFAARGDCPRCRIADFCRFRGCARHSN